MPPRFDKCRYAGGMCPGWWWLPGSRRIIGLEILMGRFEVFEEGPDFGLGPVQLPAGCVPRSCVGQETAVPGPGSCLKVDRLAPGQPCAKLPVRTLARQVPYVAFL